MACGTLFSKRTRSCHKITSRSAMLSGCHSGSALCATCSFCMRLAHSRAGCNDKHHILAVAGHQAARFGNADWACSLIAAVS
jgi:hypothetical protein